MKHLLLQPLTMRRRSLTLPGRQPLHRVFRASVLLLLTSALFLPLKALAQPSALHHASGSFSNQNVVANQPLASATKRIPAMVVDRLRQDLSQRTQLPVAKLKLLETAPKTWNDGCLGLARSDEICTQAFVEGWRVIFSSGRQRWIYRTDQQGRSYRLEP